MFKFNDIEKIVLLSGYEFRSSKGSHFVYTHKKTGFSVTVPNHPKGVSIGVAEKVIKACVLVCRLDNINIGSYKNKLHKEAYNIIESHHQKVKENKLFLLPEENRAQHNIQTQEDVLSFLKTYKKRYNMANCQEKDFSQ